MPETPFTVQLPDGSRRRCYSPSSVVRKHFESGQILPASEFLTEATTALTTASRRVQEKFGFT